MNEKTTSANGVQVREDWLQRITEAQEIKSYTIGGKEYLRIRYGARKTTGAASVPFRVGTPLFATLHPRRLLPFIPCSP